MNKQNNTMGNHQNLKRIRKNQESMTQFILKRERKGLPLRDGCSPKDEDKSAIVAHKFADSLLFWEIQIINFCIWVPEFDKEIDDLPPSGGLN